jgi:hypothetical protein
MYKKQVDEYLPYIFNRYLDESIYGNSYKNKLFEMEK